MFLLILGAILALPLLSAGAALPETDAVLKGAAYLKSVQRADGTYGSDAAGQNMDSIFAVRAAGYDPAKDLVGGVGPVQYLSSKAAAVANSAEAGKAALAAKALGLDPKAVGGTNLVAKINSGLDSGTGKFAPGDDFSQSIAMLGLSCTGNPVPGPAVAALKGSQLDDGGWGFGGFADPDTTAIAIQALLAAGVPKTDAAVADALAFLKATQGEDGGWGFDPTASNASSTAFAVQALLALGENPSSAAYTKSGATPVTFMLSQQQADGSFLGFDPTYATNQVLPALAGRTFCNAVDTPITRVRPVVVATPTAAAQPTAPPPTAGSTQAPLPPSAGTGAPGATGANVPLLAVAALTALGGGFALARAARRK
jgi:hypothetical protein